MLGGWTEDHWDDDEEAEASAEWLTMLQAVDLLATARSLTNPAAKESLLELVADGQLKLRCQRSLLEPDVGLISWRHRLQRRRGYSKTLSKAHSTARSKGSIAAQRQMSPPTFMSFRPQTLARTYWLQRDGWSIDRSRVDWVSNMIVATKLLEIGDKSDGEAQICLMRRAADGIEIFRDLAFFPLSAAELALRTDQLAQKELVDQQAQLEKTKKRRGGGRDPSEEWNEWIAELTIFIHEIGFNPRGGKEKNYSLIRDRLLARGLKSPPYSKVEKAIGAIRRRWLEYLDEKTDQPAETAPTSPPTSPESEPSPDG